MKVLKNYFFLILSVVIVFLLFNFFTKKKIENLQNIYPLLNQQRENLSVLKKKSEVLSGLDELTLTDKVKKLNFILPSEKSIDGLMYNLERICQEASVSITSLDFSPGVVTNEKAKDQQDNFDIRLIIEGRIANIKDLIEKLKNNFIAFKIKNLKISNPSVKEENIKTTTSLTLTVYYKTIPLTLGEITKALPLLTKDEEKILLNIENIPLPEQEIYPITPEVYEGRNPFY